MIPHNRPTLGKEEANAAAQVITSNKLVSGYQSQAFEDEICEFLGLPQGHAACVSSGTSALYLAMLVLELTGKKVAIPSYSCTALKHACTLSGALPNYIDIQQELPVPLLDGADFDALIYPYLYGLASKPPEIHNKYVIEDIAQSLGASVNNQKLATFGDIGVLSFYATKMISSGGQGGMLVSKNKGFIEIARSYLNFDQVIDDKQRFNLHITEAQCAIGREQLKKLPTFIEQRQAIWEVYANHQLPLLDITEPGLTHVRYRAIVKTERVNELINYLSQKEISTINPFTYDELLARHNPNAAKMCKTTLSLPIYPSLKIEQAKYIAESVVQGIEKV